MNKAFRGWESIRSCEDLCEGMPGRVRAWLGLLDLEREGLEEIRASVQADDLVRACDALIAYFEGNGAGAWLREAGETSNRRPSAGADDALRDVFSIQGVTDTVPRNGDGGINWYHRGPRDDHEYALLFNRHGYFEALLRSWRATGDARYASGFDRLLRDWVIHNPPPSERTREPNWRCLEVGLRSGYSWPHSFFGFLASEDFTPAGRVMMVGSLGEHAAHLLAHWGHANPNITLMELNGMGTVPMMFPEFRASEEWLRTATDGMMEQLGKQVYPDGAQNELTVGYHEVARRHFEHFSETLQLTGHPVPELFRKTLVSMWHYTSGVVRPDGHIPMNNDSDRHAKGPEILAAAEKYGRPDWAYIASNGKTGEAPEGVPSRAYPWAGQLVSRSGWEADAHWSFFDFGPWGASHQHNDKLHLSIGAFGRDILVDSGRFAYGGVVGQKYRRPYATQSRAHNVILVDGQGQGPGPRTVESPVDQGDFGTFEHFDFARGSFTDFAEIEGEFTHRRIVVYVRGKFWIVVDRLETDRPREVEALWHFHPSCSVRATGPAVFSDDAEQGNVRIDVLGRVPWEVGLVQGQEEPSLQGWYSQTYNDVQENTCACYSSHLPASETAVWLIHPSRGVRESPISEILHWDASETVVDVAGTQIVMPHVGAPVSVTLED